MQREQLASVSCIFVIYGLRFKKGAITGASMTKEEIITTLMALLKPDAQDTADVFYNAGIIDAIKAIEKLSKRKQ
jgi:hypothetical protein